MTRIVVVAIIMAVAGSIADKATGGALERAWSSFGIISSTLGGGNR